MPDFGSFRGFGDKLVAGQLPTQLGVIGSQEAFEFDADAQAFFDRVTTASGTLSATEKTAVDTLVKQMKLDGTWTPMKAIYPMVGASAAACAQNLKSSSFTGVFVGGVTYSSLGITGNGINGYMNTQLIPDNELSLNNTHLCYYSRSNSSGDFISMGTNDNAINALPLFKTNPKSTLSNFENLQYSYQAGQILNVPNLDSRGFYLISRISSTSNKSFKNGSVVGTSTTAQNQTRISKFSLSLMGSNNNGTTAEFSPRQYAYFSIGDGLTDTQASNLYTAVQAFQTTLSRQV
jgi:hypothetical protein